MSKHDTVEHIEKTFNVEFARLVQFLIAIKSDKAMPARIRKWAALYAANNFLESLPILNADPDLLAPINAIINDLAGPMKRGGRDRAHDRLVHEARAVVDILKSKGWSVENACTRIASIMTNNGRPTAWGTVRDWTVGQRRDEDILAMRVIKDYVAVWKPSIINDDLDTVDRALLHFETQARRWAKFED
ncbi:MULTISPECIES: hypothetical protein [unclassified Ruegeria]|uniref:hypothetical protein n=1 Tax=unclassified Ruegeria TaxID=2625375 RepID=UPI001AD9AE47|nr:MULTISPECIES: hypothetical protein [unclassified Ruegeria]MBO9410825.1 hypothetical protein [Ruegeria sp. R8_1]MBO9415026.1 hypothetical protein [Ruegeria sp. R8_2]